jgi:hypothetical protein
MKKVGRAVVKFMMREIKGMMGIREMKREETSQFESPFLTSYSLLPLNY